MLTDLPDIHALPADLAVPPLGLGGPTPGARVRQALPSWAGTDVHHTLYLPRSWRPDRPHPLIIEYAGNGPYEDDFGDRCTGRVEDARLGFGLADHLGAVWACLPCVSGDHRTNQLMWWGDAEATVDYASEAVPFLCDHYAADPHRVLLSGFSRGAIACNYIGLRSNRIAGLWRAFFCHSHYDGVRPWGYAGDDAASARQRLARLEGRPQFISHEGSAQPTRDLLAAAGIDAPLTFLDLPYRNHTDAWMLRDLPERRAIRAWAAQLLSPR